MGGPPVERKLAAILSADVEGYSRLMGDDEVATVRTITEYREAIASSASTRRSLASVPAAISPQP